jgi:hypothetical protein
MIVERSVECSERKKGRSTATLLKVVDEIEEIQRVEGPPSRRALAEEDDSTLVAAAQSGRNGETPGTTRAPQATHAVVS